MGPVNIGRAAACLGVVVLVGCTAVTDDAADGPATPEPAPTTAPPPVTADTGPPEAPSPATAPSPSPEPEPPHPVSLPAMFEAEYEGADLTVGETLARTDAYTRYAVTYSSDGLTVSGIMNVPAGDGPFPVLVLAHGYIDPAVYTTGRGLAREQDHLARAGYAVLHTDYRNHAGSDEDPDNELRLRLGYTADVINAVLAVRGSDLPYLDGDRVGLLGRSMGGGVTYNVLVTRPGLVDAAVVYAPVSSDAADNFDRWIRGNAERGELADAIVGEYGAPEDEPEFWANVSPRTFFDRVTEPLLVHHGTADESCPIEWSHATVEALETAGKDVTLLTYEGEPHAFEAAWPQSIERTTEFFDDHLG